MLVSWQGSLPSDLAGVCADNLTEQSLFFTSPKKEAVLGDDIILHLVSGVVWDGLLGETVLLEDILVC